ncbi:MAG: hypothetical protein LC107_07270 [Chitinophagales bacterium]|nr:hypothetical protein [Chitinophagales bacterium]
MKKCNYFSSFVVVFLLFLGATLNAQSYKSSSEAIKAIQGFLEQEKPKYTAAIDPSVYKKSNADVIVASKEHAKLDRDTKLKVKRVQYGNALLDVLSKETSVANSILKVTTAFELPSKSMGELDILQEVDAFYKNLLSK